MMLLGWPRRAGGRALRPVFATVLAAVVAAVLAGFVAPTAASAHAVLDDTVPRAGAILEVAPNEIVLDFDDDIEIGLSYTGLFTAAGEPIALDRAVETPDRTQLVVPITDPFALGAGTYVVAYRVTAVDGHVEHDTFAFQIGTQASDQIAAVRGLSGLTDPAAHGWEWTLGVLRGAGLAGLALLLGTFAVVLLTRRESDSAPTSAPDAGPTGTGLVGAVLVAVCAVLSIAVQGGLSSAGSPSALFDTGLWSEVIATQFGALTIARAALGAVAVVIVVSIRLAATRAWRAAALTLSLCLLGTFAWSGHAARGRLAALGVLLDLVHRGAALVWLGGLVVIVLARRSLLASDGRPARPVEVWTTKGLWAVGVLVITGVLQMWRTVDRPGSLGDTAYGRTLVGKTALVVFVLVIAVMLRGVLRRHGPRSARSLFVSQTVLALMVTGVSVGLAGAAPNERPSSVPVTVSARADDLTASLTLTPARAGSNDVHLVVSEVGATEPTRAARAVLTNPERGLTDLVIPLVPDGPDHYSAYAVQIAVPGTWQVRLEVDTSSGTVTLDLQVSVSDR